MPLEASDHQYWRAAVGYVELGMFQEANDQLENIDPFNRAAPEVLAVRIAVYQGLKNGSWCEKSPNVSLSFSQMTFNGRFR
jgi:hypothetical protein